MPDFQLRVRSWMLACFGPIIAADRAERNHRFFEESTELVQAGGMTREEAHALVDYTFDRPVGEKHQEVGGVMVTLAALCLAHGIDMELAAENEYDRINVPDMIEKIRTKQQNKPKFSPLPQHVGPANEATQPWHNNLVQFARLLCEINATQPVDFQALRDSMDLSEDDLDELFDRAHETWESSKLTVGGQQ